MQASALSRPQKIEPTHLNFQHSLSTPKTSSTKSGDIFKNISDKSKDGMTSLLGTILAKEKAAMTIQKHKCAASIVT